MSLESRLESLRGLPYAEVLAAVQSDVEIKLGRLLPTVVPDIKTILAYGLRDRIAKFVPSPASHVPEEMQRKIKVFLVEAFEDSFLNNPEFSINFALPEIWNAFMAACDVGLILDSEKAKLISLAQYKAPKYKDISMVDIVKYYEPDVVIPNVFPTFESRTSDRLMLKVNKDLPEPTVIKVKVQESHNGVDWGVPRGVTYFYDVQDKGIYYTDIPVSGLHRRFICSSITYKVEGTIEAI